MVAPITSAAGVVTLLDEPEPELQSYALTKLNELVDSFWAEIADSVSKIEILYEDVNFPDRQLAALVASKVFFHLGEETEALTFALGAGKLFDVDQKDEYTDTVICEFSTCQRQWWWQVATTRKTDEECATHSESNRSVHTDDVGCQSCSARPSSGRHCGANVCSMHRRQGSPAGARDCTRDETVRCD